MNSKLKRNSLNKSDIDVKLESIVRSCIDDPRDRTIGEAKADIQALIRTEKLKLLAEVREQTTIFKIKSHDEKGQPHLYEAGRGVPTEALDKLEAEL